MPSLLTLPDVFSTSYRAALAGGVNERTRVTVIGDGPVDLLAVLSAKRLVRVGQRGRRRRADVDLELCWWARRSCGGGLVVRLCPDVVEAAAGLVAAQGEDRGGAGDVPAHAGQFQALTDEGIEQPASTTPEPTNRPCSRK